MAAKIKKFLRKITLKRTTVVILLFVFMSAVLIQHLFQLQIVDGEKYASQFSVMTTKKRTIKSTRGTIYDRNGNILASNRLSYSLTLEDNGSYETMRQKNLTLNGVAYRLLQILKDNNDEPDRDFHIILDDAGNYIFDTETEVTINRFRADIYGYALIEDLKDSEKNATPEEIMEYLLGEERFSIVLTGEDTYTEEELKEYGIPQELTGQELLDMAIIRYELSTNSFKKYIPVTIATDVSEETVASVMENKNTLQGVDITEDSVREYQDAIYFANIIGYTGKASTEELDELEKQNPEYNSTSIIGKTGIEKYMELELQGKEGEETVYVDKLGKILKIDDSSRIEPKAGNDVYLTIDKNLQIACYKILEQRIAGILINQIFNGKTFNFEAIGDANQVEVPIYDVYNALIGNSVIDISHFEEEDASETEKKLYNNFLQKQKEVFDRIRNELTAENTSAYKDLDKEMQEYVSYVVNDLLTSKLGIISSDAINTNDAMYIAWNSEKSISLQQYLTYAASQNWIDLSQLHTDGDYLDSTEVYSALSDYITEYLKTDKQFSRLLYKYLLMNDVISGTDLCMILYDQNLLSKDDGMYESLASGQISSYDFMIQKIASLEITPGQLALDPCSGSIVLTDPNNGQVLACVTYPGYDNNRLANNMDVNYYNQLLYDQSQPFFNKATQQRTAPGSTFKLLSAIAGLDDHLIDDNTYINCTGKFDIVQPINCWNKQGHGNLEIRGAIENSCNVFFNTVGYYAGRNSKGEYSEGRSLQVLQKYASMLDLDKKTGIEIDEAAPHVSDEMAIPSYMGQGTHLYTTVGLARYASTIANEGTSYQLSLIGKTTDSKGKVLKENQPIIQSTLNLSQSIWDDLHDGMLRVVSTHGEFNGIGVQLAGKTGTAQESNVRPDHGLFIGFAPYDEPEIAMAIRIPYGYGSGNACLVASDVVKYAFNVGNKEDILTGTATTTISNTSND